MRYQRWLRLGGAALLALAATSAAGAATNAATGSAFTYQGHLSREGAPVSAICDFQFSLWDHAQNGGPVGATHGLTLPVTNGLFTARLDFGAGAFDGAGRWLAVAVRCPAGGGDFTDLEPRAEVTAAPYAQYALAAPWAGLQGVPADLADGDQNTTYTAGPGLTLSGATFQADTTLLQRRVVGACPAGQYLQQIAADGSVRCAPDAGLVFAPGSGLDFTDGVLAANASLARAAEVPALASQAGFITLVQANSLYQITAGDGLARIGNTLSVMTESVQARVSEQCAAGSYLRAVQADGTVVCGLDADSGGTLTGVTAGAGLIGGGAAGTVTLNADPAYLQRRVSGFCAAGEKITAIAADGSVTCTPDADTRYTAGAGLVLNEAIFSMDGSIARQADITPTVAAAGFITQAWADEAYQARVTGGCAVGQHLTAIAADGSVTCGDDPGYTAGAGLTLTGRQFSIPPGAVGAAQVVSAAVQLRVAGSCAVGQYVRAIAADGSVTCGLDASGPVTGVSAGAGLTGGGSSGIVSLAVVTGTIQARVTGACAVGQYVRAIAADGSVTCGADAGGTVTGVTAGAGLTGGGAVGAVSLALDQTAVQGAFVPVMPAVTAFGTAARPVGTYSVSLAGLGLSGARALSLRLSCKWATASSSVGCGTKYTAAAIAGSAYATSFLRALVANSASDLTFVAPVDGATLYLEVLGADATSTDLTITGYFR